MKVNDVQVEDTFKIVPAASSIYYVDKDTVRQILLSLKG